MRRCWPIAPVLVLAAALACASLAFAGEPVGGGAAPQRSLSGSGGLAELPAPVGQPGAMRFVIGEGVSSRLLEGPQAGPRLRSGFLATVRVPEPASHLLQLASLLSIATLLRRRPVRCHAR